MHNLKILLKTLPCELVDHIKLFTGNGVWRTGKYMNKIHKDDIRYSILRSIPLIKKMPYYVQVITDILSSCTKVSFSAINNIYKIECRRDVLFNNGKPLLIYSIIYKFRNKVYIYSIK